MDALDPQLPTWSSASAEILLEFQACYSDSETYSLSAQGRWTLIENKRHHPTFLSSAFKDPASKKQEGPTYLQKTIIKRSKESRERALRDRCALQRSPGRGRPQAPSQAPLPRPPSSAGLSKGGCCAGSQGWGGGARGEGGAQGVSAGAPDVYMAFQHQVSDLAQSHEESLRAAVSNSTLFKDRDVLCLPCPNRKPLATSGY